ncbi:MAG: hypothetical protein LC799_08045 [Actinobacteria bacterium]|nr:hypothetical protein [Actinomycetota bacterium]
MTTQATPRAPLPQGRVAVQLNRYLRSAAAVAAVSALGYAAVLGWRTDANGVVTAAAFAVGFLFATFALAGVVPASIKIGDVELKMQQERKDAADEGRVQGLEAGAAISKVVAAGELRVDQVEAALRAALTSPESLRVDGIDLPVPQLAPPAAEKNVQKVADALTTVAEHSERPNWPTLHCNDK